MNFECEPEFKALIYLAFFMAWQSSFTWRYNTGLL